MQISLWWRWTFNLFEYLMVLKAKQKTLLTMLEEVSFKNCSEIAALV